jgi:hypothetical protein
MILMEGIGPVIWNNRTYVRYSQYNYMHEHTFRRISYIYIYSACVLHTVYTYDIPVGLRYL